MTGLLVLMTGLLGTTITVDCTLLEEELAAHVPDVE